MKTLLLTIVGLVVLYAIVQAFQKGFTRCRKCGGRWTWIVSRKSRRIDYSRAVILRYMCGTCKCIIQETRVEKTLSAPNWINFPRWFDRRNGLRMTPLNQTSHPIGDQCNGRLFNYSLLKHSLNMDKPNKSCIVSTEWAHNSQNMPSLH